MADEEVELLIELRESEFLRVRLTKHAHPGADDHLSDNWLNADIDIAVSVSQVFLTKKGRLFYAYSREGLFL